MKVYSIREHFFSRMIDNVCYIRYVTNLTSMLDVVNLPLMYRWSLPLDHKYIVPTYWIIAQVVYGGKVSQANIQGGY